MPPSGKTAFTLIEILVAVALLSFIVLGLFAMFNQVQRAFRSTMNQVDQMEAGRAVAQLLPAELEQTAPCNGNASACNFSTRTINSAPLTQSLPGTGLMRMNLLQDCFILLRQNQTWVGIGYCVRTADPATGRLYWPISGPGQLGAGTLYRFTATLPVLYYNPLGDPRNGTAQDPSQLYAAFTNACVSGSLASTAISNRICDGVVHFCLQAFATNGFPIVSGNSATNAAFFRTNAFTIGYGVVRQAQAVPNLSYPGNPGVLYFWSNAVPASVELQLGILESHAWDRYNSISDPNARLAYLQRSENASRVNLFRQRIPIRNVNPLAYQ